MKVLSIGPDKDLMRPGSVSYTRHAAYAAHLTELHAVVFARREHGGKRVTIAGNAWAYPTNAGGTLGLFVNAYRIGRTLLRAEGQWVISAQDPFESGIVAYALSRVTGVPFMLQEHGDFFSLPHWRRESLANRLRYPIGLFLLRRAHHVRTVAARITETLARKGVPRERMSVVPVYTSLGVFSNATPAENITSLRPEGGVLLLTLARFVPQKNLSLLIRAFMRTSGGPRAHLVLIGKGPERAHLESLARTLGNTLSDVPAQRTVSFLDWTDDSAGALKAADIYALSSDYEGWGRVVIEAFAAGVPVIMTDVGCADEVARDKENALIVPVRDEQALAHALDVLIENQVLRERLSCKGKETVAALPTEEEYRARYVQCLKRCIVPEHANDTDQV